MPKLRHIVVALVAAVGGAPVRKSLEDYGGMWGLLQKLRSGRHPKTGGPLPSPTCSNGLALDSQCMYSRPDQRRIDANALSVVPYDSSNRFVPYVPMPDRILRPSEGKSAKIKMEEMLCRVRRREAADSRRYRLRGKQRPRRVDTSNG